MLLFYLLLLSQIFLFVRCNDFGDKTLPKEHLLELSIPDLTPYDGSSDPFAALDSTLKVYLQSLFSGAVYEPKCEHSKKPIIEVVYFWPGKRVDLPCRMCRRSSTFNGQIKHWAFWRSNIPDAVTNLQQTIKHPDSSAWKIIDQNFSDIFVTQNKLPYMPVKEATPDQTQRIYRPKTQFFQRDGKLIILHPYSDSYGLYRCFDHESRDFINFAYFLIPIIPLLSGTTDRWNVPHFNQCPSPSTNPRVAPKTYTFLDEFHQFHFLPAVLPKSDEFCPKANPTCKVNTFTELSQPPLDNIAQVQMKGDPATAAEDLTEKVNLKIFVSWSNWSSCSNGEALKTRYGFCHIGKLNASIPFDEDDIGGPGSDFRAIIHRLIEAVEDFSENGIRLFSGILAELLEPDEPHSHCKEYEKNTQNWKKFQESVIEVIKAATKDSLGEIGAQLRQGWKTGIMNLFDSVCLRSIYELVDTKTKSKLEYGQKIIQNEPC